MFQHRRGRGNADEVGVTPIFSRGNADEVGVTPTSSAFPRACRCWSIDHGGYICTGSCDVVCLGGLLRQILSQGAYPGLDRIAVQGGLSTTG